MSVNETKAYFDTSKVTFISKTLTIGEHHAHYIQTGNPDSPTLFFVHGSPGSWDAYKRYLTDTILLKKYRMIAIDRPGFGYSDFGAAENLEDQSAIMETVVAQTANGKPFVLIGHSLGGPLIVKMATDRPELFQHLIILAGSVDPRMETAEVWRPIFMAKPLRYLVPGAFRPANDELWWLKDDLEQMKPELKKVTSHIVIIHGTKDRLVPYGNVDFMEREFVKAKSVNIIAVENANHFILWEHFKLIRDTLAHLRL